MRHGILATLLILCGLLPRAASAMPADDYFALTLTPDTPTAIIGADDVRAPAVPEPTALSLLAGALLLMWAVTRRRPSRRNVSIE